MLKSRVQKNYLSCVISLLFLLISFDLSAGQAGFHLTKVEKDSVYARLGMQEGDVLQSYNGHPLRSEKDLKALLELLQKEDSPTVKLVIDRKGQHKELVYNFGQPKNKADENKNKNKN